MRDRVKPDILNDLVKPDLPSVQFNFKSMSNLQNEILLENIYEEVIAEATDTGNLAMMSEKDIETEVYNRFYSISD